jgi:hypothetical protein
MPALLVGLLAIAAANCICTGVATAHPAPSDSGARVAAMAKAASDFLATLSAEERERLVRRFDDDAARTNWSNLPSNQYTRDGIALADLSDTQRRALHTLLANAMSSQGYAKAYTIMWFDDLLRVEDTQRLTATDLSPEQRARLQQLAQRRSSGNYWVVMFGEPGAARWGWMISGHHLAANFTVVDGKVAFTPLFVGAAPQTVQQGPYAGWRLLDHEIARGFTLVRSLNVQQRRAAIISGTVTDDLFTGKGRKDTLRTPVGIPASALDEGQQQMLWGLVREFVASAADEPAQAQLEAIRRDGLEKLHFAWWGSADDPKRQFMYRIHGPSILIEYVRENDRSGPANHVHAIVRDPRNDYGEDWLSRHYAEQPHP